jgi:hypothetical protein
MIADKYLDPKVFLSFKDRQKKDEKRKAWERESHNRMVANLHSWNRKDSNDNTSR